jgi:hypothetical protein
LSSIPCSVRVQLRQQLTEENLIQLSEGQVRFAGEAIMQNLWLIRVRLHQQLAQLPVCRDQIYMTFQHLRGVEDLIGDRYYAEKPLHPNQIDFAHQPIPMRDNDYFHGYRVIPELQGKNFEFQSGDILISRGISFFSAALTHIPQPVGEFSHMGLVYKDDQGNVSMMESYPQTNGVTIFAEGAALQHENVRLMILRPKDTDLGKRAAETDNSHAEGGVVGAGHARSLCKRPA